MLSIAFNVFNGFQWFAKVSSFSQVSASYYGFNGVQFDFPWFSMDFKNFNFVSIGFNVCQWISTAFDVLSIVSNGFRGFRRFLSTVCMYSLYV